MIINHLYTVITKSSSYDVHYFPFVRNHEMMYEYLSLSGLRSNYEKEEVEYMLVRLPSH